MFLRTFVSACLASAAISLKLSDHQTPSAIATILSQTQTAISGEICQRAATANKADVPDFYAIHAGSKVFTDDKFPHTSAAFAWSDAGEVYSAANEAAGTQWKRAKDVFPKKTLWGTNGITPQDMRQGEIGNCWFIAGASALAEKKGRLENVFLNTANENSANGIYGVNLFVLGQPHTIIVDDYLPLRKDDNGGWVSHASKIGLDGSLWGAILEKAFAKYHGNYEHTVGGNPAMSLRTLYGAPEKYIMHKDSTSTADLIWTEITAAEGRGDIILMGTEGSDHF